MHWRKILSSFLSYCTRYLHSRCLLLWTVRWMRCAVYLLLLPSSHEIWACPSNTATPLIRPIFLGPLVTVNRSPGSCRKSHNAHKSHNGVPLCLTTQTKCTLTWYLESNMYGLKPKHAFFYFEKIMKNLRAAPYRLDAKIVGCNHRPLKENMRK